MMLAEVKKSLLQTTIDIKNKKNKVSDLETVDYNNNTSIDGLETVDYNNDSTLGDSFEPK